MMSTGRAWVAQVEGVRAFRVLEILDQVGHRLFDEDSVAKVNDGPVRQPASLAAGLPGLALCALVLDQAFPESDFGQAAARSIAKAAVATQDAPVVRPGLFVGSAGLAFSVEILANRDHRYRRSADRIRDQVVGQVLSSEWSCPEDGVSFGDYDAISGAAGVLRYLLAASNGESTDLAINKLLGYLVFMSLGKGVGGRPRWFVDSKKLPKRATLASRHPTGFFDLGLAHGVSGILVVLALAWEAGYRVDGQAQALERLAHWIIDQRLQNVWGISWPQVVPAQSAEPAGAPAALEPFRPAWCYGAAGIMRSLRIAGRVLGDENLQNIAVKAARAMMFGPEFPEPDGGTANICHGEAGRLAILLRFAHDTDVPGINLGIDAAVDRICAHYNARHAFGFKDQADPDTCTDDPGFLNGAAGICMALAAAVTPNTPEWDQVLLIS